MSPCVLLSECVCVCVCVRESVCVCERERLNTTFIKILTVFLFGFLIQPYNC